MKLWHGSPYRFEKFSLHNAGKGEGGNALGLGCYLSEELKVAQRFADYARKTRGQGFLYEVTLQCLPGELLDLDATTAGPAHSFGAKHYFELLAHESPEKTLIHSRALGLVAVKAWEQDDRGFVTMVLAPERLHIENRQTWINNSWQNDGYAVRP